MKYLVQIITKDYLELEKFRNLIDIGILNKNRKKIKFICDNLISVFNYIDRYNIKYKSLNVIYKGD